MTQPIRGQEQGQGTGTPTQTGSSGARADAADPGTDVAQLRARLVELQRERDHLIAIVDILQDVSGTLHFVDILQTISRKVGDTFGLDRCAIFLTDPQQGLRLVASYEDPSIRNLVVDIERYPELRRAFDSKQTIFIPDVTREPTLSAVQSQLQHRNVRSILVVPMQSQGSIIGAIFVRTRRDGKPFSDPDVQFCQIVATLAAKALRNAHRFETLMRQQRTDNEAQRRADLRRVGLLMLMQEVLDRHNRNEEHSWAETLSKPAREEVDRLAAVVMQVLEEQEAG